MLQEKDCRAVDVGIASAALFVMQDSSIAHTRENQTMLDVPNLFFIPGKPGDSADCAGDEKKAIGIAPR